MMKNRGLDIQSYNGGCEYVFEKDQFNKLLYLDANISKVYYNTLLALHDGPLKIGPLYEKIQLYSNGEKCIKKSALDKQLKHLVRLKIVFPIFESYGNPIYDINIAYFLGVYLKYRINNEISINPSCEALLNHLNSGNNPNLSFSYVQKSENVVKKSKRDITYERESNAPNNKDDFVFGKRTQKGLDIEMGTKSLIDALKKDNSLTRLAYYRNQDLYREKLDKKERSLEEDLIGDYNNFIVGRPDREKDVRCMLWDSDIFHILDMYDRSFDRFMCAKKLAEISGLNFNEILTDSQISEGHILLHMNDLNGAKENFNQTLLDQSTNEVLKARTLFRRGEIEVYQWDLDDAIKSFDESLKICDELDATQKNKSIQHIRADALRKKGTALRLKGDLNLCEECYLMAEDIYNTWEFRGLTWLLHGWAELFRAKGEYKQSFEMYKKALDKSEKILNVNRIAHAQLGICEILRLNNEIQITPKPKVDKLYHDAEKKYVRIKSLWGHSQIIISKSIKCFFEPDLSNEVQEEMYKALFEARKMCINMGLKGEISLINRIIKHDIDRNEINPLSLF